MLYLMVISNRHPGRVTSVSCSTKTKCLFMEVCKTKILAFKMPMFWLDCTKKLTRPKVKSNMMHTVTYVTYLISREDVDSLKCFSGLSVNRRVTCQVQGIVILHRFSTTRSMSLVDRMPMKIYRMTFLCVILSNHMKLKR